MPLQFCTKCCRTSAQVLQLIQQHHSIFFSYHPITILPITLYHPITLSHTPPYHTYPHCLHHTQHNIIQPSNHCPYHHLPLSTHIQYAYGLSSDTLLLAVKLTTPLSSQDARKVWVPLLWGVKKPVYVSP